MFPGHVGSFTARQELLDNRPGDQQQGGIERDRALPSDTALEPDNRGSEAHRDGVEHLVEERR